MKRLILALMIVCMMCGIGFAGDYRSDLEEKVDKLIKVEDEFEMAGWTLAENFEERSGSVDEKFIFYRDTTYRVSQYVHHFVDICSFYLIADSAGERQSATATLKTIDEYSIPFSKMIEDMGDPDNKELIKDMSLTGIHNAYLYKISRIIADIGIATKAKLEKNK